MMVERTPDVKNTEQFLKELDHAAAKLAEISKKKRSQIKNSMT